MTATAEKETVRVRINSVFAQLYGRPERYMIIYGGRRSSKSYSVSQLLARRALENTNRKIVIMRKYATTIRMSAWSRTLAAIEEAVGLKYCQVNKTDREIIMPSGSVFYFVGADDPQKLKSIEGVTDYWLEEANEFDEIDFDTVDAGLSATVDPHPQMWLTFNPIPVFQGMQHWIQRRFLSIEHRLGEIASDGLTCILRTYYRHNAFCPQSTIDVLERYKQTNPELYKLWGLGEFTNLHGAIITDWDIVDAPPEGVSPLGIGLDFGFADDPAAVCRIWKNSTEIWAQELIYATGLTNPQLSVMMEEAGLIKGQDHIVADSAEPKSIKELKDSGWLITGSEKGPDYKRAAAKYIQGHKLHIVKGSTNFVKEIATWLWQADKRTGKLLPIPTDGNDHLIDAMIGRVYKHQRAVRFL